MGNEVKGKPSKEFPSEWLGFPFAEYFEKGFKPRKKDVHGHTYITLFDGRHEKSLGRFSQDRWELAVHMYNIWSGEQEIQETEKTTEETEEAEETAETEETPEEKERKHLEYLSTVPQKRGIKASKTILGTKVNRPVFIPSTFTPDLDTIYYFQLLQHNGYPGTFEQFLNETVKLYFSKEKGISPGLVITVSEEEGKD